MKFSFKDKREGLKALINSVDFGRNIKRLPSDFKIDIYRQFNKDYENLDTFELIRIIISNPNFVLRLNKLPENFNTKIYKNIHDNLKELSEEALKEH